MSSAGEFAINISGGGYPIWCEICYDGKTIVRVHHRELRDLAYVADRAINEARLALKKLGLDKDEV